MVEGCDYSFGRPDPPCLHASGIRFAVRYTSTGGSAKNMSPNEVDGLVAAGIALVTVFEESAGHMLAGRTAGIAAAEASVALAAACGMPPDRPHYYALDIDPNALSGSQWNAIKAYLDGAASVHGKAATGVYAGFRGIEELVPTWAPWGWQTYAWSGGRWSAKAVLQQYRNGVTRCGAQVDLCRALAADYGQWGLGQEDDMPLNDADKAWIAARLEESERRVARYVDHGDAAVTGSGNHHVKVREDLAGVSQDLAQLKAQVSEVKATVDGLVLGKLDGDLDVTGVLHLEPPPPPPVADVPTDVT